MSFVSYSFSTNLYFSLGLCDFQLLPMVSDKDNFEAEGEVIYEKICPKEIPSFDWFM